MCKGPGVGAWLPIQEAARRPGSPEWSGKGRCDREAVIEVVGIICDHLRPHGPQ